MSLILSLLSLLREHLSLVVLTLLLVLLAPTIISSFRKHWRQYWAFKPVPRNPDQHPIFGDSPKMLADREGYVDYYAQLVAKNRWKVLRLDFAPGLRMFMATHPDSVKMILRSDPKSEDFYRPLETWLGRGLLISNGSKWARSRKLLTPAFHYEILRPYVGVYGEAANEMVGLWAELPEGESFDVFPYLGMLTLDIMLRCAFSHKSNCQVSRNHSQYIKATSELSMLAMTRSFTFYKSFDLIYFFTPDYWQTKRHCETVHGFARSVITQRRKELKDREMKGTGDSKPKRRYRDFIDILLEEKDEDGVGMSDAEIRAEVDTFMFAGHDTTSSGIVWTLYNLALHPEHQEICRREVDEVLDQKDNIEMQDLKSLEYLKCCIKESLRLFPPAVAVGRVLKEPTEICGYKMPEGTSCVADIYTVHHHPEFWENPYDFDPYRFTLERSKGRHSHAFIPFSAGPRNCIGQEFAINELRVVVATILRHFEIALDETRPVSKEVLVIMKPKNGLYLKLKHRRH